MKIVWTERVINNEYTPCSYFYPYCWDPHDVIRNNRNLNKSDTGIPESFKSGILSYGTRNSFQGQGIQNPVPEIRNQKRGIQKQRLSWITLDGRISPQLLCLSCFEI